VYTAKKGAEEPMPIGLGYAPHFIDDLHVVFISGGQVVVHNMVTSMRTVIGTLPADLSLSSKVTYSPDRTLMVWTDLAGGMSTVARISPTTYEVVRTMPALNSPVLTNTAVYDVVPATGGAKLVTYDLATDTASRTTFLPFQDQIVSITLRK